MSSSTRAVVSTVGIIGGIAPDSTVDYYHRIIARYRERSGGTDNPALVINSINLERLVAYVTGNRLDELTDWLIDELRRLKAARVDFAVLSSNTPHIVFDRLKPRTPVPLLSIVEATCAHAQAQRMRRVGLIGTRFTMEAGFYQQTFAATGVQLATPSADERTLIHTRYMDELIHGTFRPETRAALASISRALQARERLDGIILGGTELPLLLRDADLGCPPLDTTVIHVEAIVQRMLELEGGTPAINQEPARSP